MVGIKTCSIGSDCSCQGIVEWIRLLGRQQGFGSLDVTATYVRSLLPQQDDVDQAVLPVADAATPAQPTLFRGGKIFTIQPFSRKCPIGHALDIPFENWTSSLRIYTSSYVASQLECHLAMSCPAAMHGVSRDVICLLSQMDVLFSPAGEIAVLPVPPDVWYAAVCALEFVTVTPPGPWPSRESDTAAAAAATTISTTGSRWSSSRFAPRNSQPHEPGRSFLTAMESSATRVATVRSSAGPIAGFFQSSSGNDKPRQPARRHL